MKSNFFKEDSRGVLIILIIIFIITLITVTFLLPTVKENLVLWLENIFSNANSGIDGEGYEKSTLSPITEELKNEINWK